MPLSGSFHGPSAGCEIPCRPSPVCAVIRISPQGMQQQAQSSYGFGHPSPTGVPVLSIQLPILPSFQPGPIEKWPHGKVQASLLPPVACGDVGCRRRPEDSAGSKVTWCIFQSECPVPTPSWAALKSRTGVEIARKDPGQDFFPWSWSPAEGLGASGPFSFCFTPLTFCFCFKESGASR